MIPGKAMPFYVELINERVFYLGMAGINSPFKLKWNVCIESAQLSYRETQPRRTFND